MSFSFKKLNPLAVEEENFWPSFADVMMMVVIVFVLVMVVLVAKNWDLVEKLKSSIQAEQKISATATIMNQENSDLKEKLDSKDQQIAMLQMKLLSVEGDLEDTQLRFEKTQDLVENQAERIIILADTKQQLENKVAELNLGIEEAKAESSEKGQIIIALEDSFSQAKEEFKALKYKYDKLIRPARSPKGKTVIEINYLKNDNQSLIRLTEPGKKTAIVSRKEMHEILTRYQAIDPAKLYLKIIFPDESKISHQEAWRFTSSLLEKYDYYYQK